MLGKHLVGSLGFSNVIRETKDVSHGNRATWKCPGSHGRTRSYIFAALALIAV